MKLLHPLSGELSMSLWGRRRLLWNVCGGLPDYAIPNPWREQPLSSTPSETPVPL